MQTRLQVAFEYTGLVFILMMIGWWLEMQAIDFWIFVVSFTLIIAASTTKK
jgi:hypothetical protein